MAANSAEIPLVDLLIANGADINLKNNAGNTPLYVAAKGEPRYSTGPRFEPKSGSDYPWTYEAFIIVATKRADHVVLPVQVGK